MTGTTGNTVIGTQVGVAANGSALGNGAAGIALTASSKNTIGSISSSVPQNVVANNPGAGVQINSGTQDAILKDSIFANGSLGIDLAAGANANQAAPVLSSVESVTAGTQVTGTLTSKPSTTYTLEFFASEAGDASGEYLLGTTTVKTNALGVATFTYTGSALPSGATFVTATATDPSNDTSEFSTAIS
jgi:hypothetical protein